jgi:spore germination protein
MLKLPYILLCLLTLTGCWDRIEMEDRGFVIAVGIDSPPKTKEAEETGKKEAPEKPRKEKRYSVTYQLVIPGALATDAKLKEPVLLLTSEGDSIFETNRMLATRTSRTPFFQHNKIIVVSEKMAKTGELGNVLDFFIRDHEMRRKTMVIVAKGKAREVLEVKPPNETLPAMYLKSVAENTIKSARIFPPVLIGDIHEYLLDTEGYVLPRVVPTPDGKEVKFAGSAVFRGHSNKMVGWLGEEETDGLNFLMDKIEGGLVKIMFKDGLINFEINDSTRDIVTTINDPQKIKFDITLKVNGQISSSMVPLNLLSEKNRFIIEDKVKEEIERTIKDTLHKVHREFKVDVMGLGKQVQLKDYTFWKEVEGDWNQGEDYYSKSSINVTVQASVQNIGNVVESQK